MLWKPFRKIRPNLSLSLLTALAVIVALPALPHSVCADAFTYGTGASRTVNAGILLLDDPGGTLPATGADNSDPYVFNVLNERSDIKPFGWSIVNPLAPKDVTAPILQRWTNHMSGTAPYQIGQNITPAMAPYWEVSLTSASSDDLAQFDILLINLIRPVYFTVAESEKLRRFVDGGGTLWIENSGPNGSTAGGDVLGDKNATPTGPLFFELRFANSNTVPSPQNNATIPSLARNPIISTPYQLSEQELSSLGDKHIGNFYETDNTTTSPNFAPPGPGFTTVIGNSGYQYSPGPPALYLPVIAEEQFGAGQVIVTCTGSANTINNYVGQALPVGPQGYNSGPYSGTNYTNAPAQDLKLLADIIAANLHSSERQNSHQTGSAVNALSSPALSWTAPVKTAAAAGGPAPPVTSVPGAVLDGHIAYVTGIDGYLRAYDVYPSEDLDGNGNPDDGIPDPQGASYDELWESFIGTGASAPTVASVNGTTYVLVQDATGVIHQFDTSVGFTNITTTGASTFGTSAGANYGSNGIPGPAPAPTFFGGRVYAGRADGTMFVYDYNSTGSAGSVVNGQVYTPLGGGPVAGEYVTASPTVGLLTQDPNGIESDIVAFLPTNMHLYTIYLGARGEQLGGTNSPFTTKLAQKQGNVALIDQNTPLTATYRTYTLNNGLPVLQSLMPTGNAFTGSPSGVPVYADYDVSWGTAANAPTAPESLTRSYVNPEPAGAAAISAPALDGHGNIYYISNGSVGVGGAGSCISCYRDQSQAGNFLLTWRFEMPRPTDPTGYVVDADGTDYTALRGFTFVGAPVADNQGLVYALATGTNAQGVQQTAVLCFSALGGVSADILASGTGTQINNVRVTQPDPINTGFDLVGGGPGPPQIPGNQFTINNGNILINSFGSPARINNGTSTTTPDMAEPFPIAATFSVGNANANGTQATLVRLHTNLSWYTILGSQASPVGASTGGLTKVGNRLYFVNTYDGLLESVVADPATEGFTIGYKFVPPLQASSGGTLMMMTPYANAGVGAVTGVPCAGNGAIIVTGVLGVTAFTNQLTLVVDSNRVMEMDSSGEAQWSVDSTTKTALAGGTAPVYSGGTGQVVTTTLDLNRPSSLTELTQNDYLVADSGNNRCVRFDRSGNVIWELTKFIDPNNLLTPGEPDTLNQPTSVQIFSRQDTNKASPTYQYTFIQYLISDTGNYRVVEVDDEYDKNGQAVVYHALEWLSRTHDAQGRSYRYQNAAYYYAPTGNQYVVALATNSRIGTPAAQPSAGTPAPANQDASGGSIVLLYYFPPGATLSAQQQAEDGTIAYTISDFYADLSGRNFDLTTATTATNAAPVTVPATATLLHIRNPRYLKVYVPKAGGNDARNYLIADDNGVFDLVQATDAQGKNAFLARWGFTQADYQNMGTPISSTQVAAKQNFARGLIPFIPTSVQLLPQTDTVNGNPIGRYLITNSYSQGEAANNFGATGPPGFGGEVFEVDHDPTTGAQITGTYSNHTLSRPVDTSALSQPAFAYRLQ